MSWQMRVFSTGLSVAAVVLLLVGQAQAGDKVNKKDAAARAQALALFQKALQVSDIRAPGSPPFELQGTIDVHEAKGQEVRGSYDLKWAAPDKWREEIHFPNYSRIRVGGHNEYWQLRSIEYETIPVYVFSETLSFARTLHGFFDYPDLLAPYKIDIKSSKHGDRQVQCVMLTANSIRSGEDFCFDRGQAELIRMENNLPGFGFDAADFDNFDSLGGKLYPSSIELLNGRHPVAGFLVSQLAPLATVDESLFAPPSGATLYADCPAGSPGASRILSKSKPKFPSGIAPSDLQASGTVAVYAVLGTDGVLHNFKVLGKANEDLADSLMDTLRGTRFSPANCTGSPLPEELITSMVLTRYPS